MIKGQNLKEQFPQMPQQMHEMITNTLANLEESGNTGAAEGNRIHFSRVKKAAVFAAALTVLMGMTVTAAALFSWDERVVEFFGGPSKALQDKMAAEGLSVHQEASASNQGITLSAVQSVQDETTIYVMLEVATEGVDINHLDFDDFQLLTEEGVDICKELKTRSIYFSVEEKEAGQPYEGIIMIRVNWTQESAIPYQSLTLHYENISCYQDAEHVKKAGVIEGTWDVPLQISDAADSTRVCQAAYPILIEEETMFQNEPAIISEITLEPMSIRMTLHMASDNDGIDMQQIDRISWNEKEGGVKAFFYGVKYKDGSREKLVCGNIGLSTTVGGWKFRAEINGIIEPQQVAAILLGADGEVEIAVE